MLSWARSLTSPERHRDNASRPWLHDIRQFELTKASIADINAPFDARALTSMRFVQIHLDGIEVYDKAGPRINAVLALNRTGRAGGG